jgi:lysozyme
MYEKNWNALREQDIIRGTYHFFRYDQDARAQARHYAQVIGENEHREITPAVDFEELSLSGATPPSVEALQDRLLLMLRTLEEANGRTPMIYTDFSMAEKWLGHPEFARYGLWLADWTTRPAPRVPATWRKAGYKLWQRSSTYTIPDNGRSPLDLDLYDGLLEDLYR